MVSAPKIRRGPIGRISDEEAEWVREEIRKRRERYPKGAKNFAIFGHKGQSKRGQYSQAKFQRGWTAQPAQQPAQQTLQQNAAQQLPPVESWWRALILTIMAILAIMVVYHFISYILPDLIPADGSDNGVSGCYTSCEGYAIVQAPGCNCPSDSYISSTTPIAYGLGCEKGCKQCICR